MAPVQVPVVQTEEIEEDEVETVPIDSLDIPDGSNAPVLFREKDKAVTKEDRDSDHQYARKALQSLIERGQTLLEEAIEHAESGGPKDVEAAAEVIAATSDAVERLMKIHKIMADVEKPNINATQVNIDKQQVVQLTTKELLDMIERGGE